MKKVKHKKRKLNIKRVITIIVIVILLIIFITHKSKNKFVGSWISEGKTIYEFTTNKEGFMKTPISKYKFKYEIKDNIISIDFIEKDLIDTDYEYTFKDDKLIMKSDRGTFTFTKN